MNSKAKNGTELCVGGGELEEALKPGLAGISDSGHQAHPACLGLEMLSIVAMSQDTRQHDPSDFTWGE